MQRSKDASMVERQVASNSDSTTYEDSVKAYILSLLPTQIKGAAPQPTSVSTATVSPPTSPTKPQVTKSLLQHILKKAK